MDSAKAQKQLGELEAKSNQIAADLDELQDKINTKRAALGVQVLDNPTQADKTQEEITRLETRASQLTAAHAEMRTRIQRATAELETAKGHEAIAQVSRLDAEISKQGLSALAKLKEAQRAFEDCAKMQLELHDLVRAYPAAKASEVSYATGFAFIAENIGADLVSFAPLAKALN